jgi:hypothetical protein
MDPPPRTLRQIGCDDERVFWKTYTQKKFIQLSPAADDDLVVVGIGDDQALGEDKTVVIINKDHKLDTCFDERDDRMWAERPLARNPNWKPRRIHTEAGLPHSGIPHRTKARNISRERAEQIGVDAGRRHDADTNVFLHRPSYDSFLAMHGRENGFRLRVSPRHVQKYPWRF